MQGREPYPLVRTEPLPGARWRLVGWRRGRICWTCGLMLIAIPVVDDVVDNLGAIVNALQSFLGRQVM